MTRQPAAALIEEVDVPPVSIDALIDAIGPEPITRVRDTVRRALDVRGTSRIWNINSTARGGGVAEMLQSIVAYCRGLDLDVRWLVIAGDEAFFTITKRLHNRLHGSAGDAGSLGPAEREAYLETLRRCYEPMMPLIRPDDEVICHDPQTAGLIPALKRHGVRVIWRCHIGHDVNNDFVDEGWEFLLPLVRQADAAVFSRPSYIPRGLDRDRCFIIQPSIDPMSPKNQPMAADNVRAILDATGLLVEAGSNPSDATFTRRDGSRGTVARRAELDFAERPPLADQPMVVQVSRWDRLKDHLGVMRTWADHAIDHETALVLAGPEAASVADDPEGIAALEEIRSAWHELPGDIKTRVYVACLPMADGEENAAIVNALQRHSRVIVQKSLHEGFGLTVTEGMWKSRPVVASAVGGIRDQIVHESTGLLIDDPRDLKALAGALQRLLEDDAYARHIGRQAREHVIENFLFLRSLQQYAQLFLRLDGHA